MGIARASTRTGLIMLVAGLIIAASREFVSVYDANPTIAQTAASAGSKGEAMPGGEEALQQVIVDIQENRSASVRMDSALAASTRRNLPRDRHMLENLGRLQYINYKGSGFDGDIYQTVFEKGSLVWTISLGRGGAIESLRFTAPQGPTAQDWIDWYALVPPDKGGASRLLIELGKLLALVGIGRFAGLRL